jgi:ABC-type transport system substrate-binding protein
MEGLPQTVEQDAPPMFRLGWGADYPDPDNFLALFIADSGNNHTRWANGKYDALVARAASEADPVHRLALYREAQRILTEQDVPMVPLFTHSQNILVKPWVRGFDLNAMEIPRRKVFSSSSMNGHCGVVLRVRPHVRPSMLRCGRFWPCI